MPQTVEVLLGSDNNDNDDDNDVVVVVVVVMINGKIKSNRKQSSFDLICISAIHCNIAFNTNM
jgi:hypothetical protein